MVALYNKSLLVALVYAACAVNALPSPHFSTFHSTHHTREVGSAGLKVTSYNPKASFETFGEGADLDIDIPLSKRASMPLKELASAYVQKKLGLDTNSTEIAWQSGYTHSIGKVAYFRQSWNGVEVANSVINVGFKGDKAISFSSSYTKPTKVDPKDPTVPLDTAVQTAQSKLEGSLVSSVDPKLNYFLKEDGSAVLTHVFQVQDQSKFKFYEAYVNAHTGELESIVDFVNEATFRAIPLTKNSPDDGFANIVDPEDRQSSPQGWITGQETAGNNAIAFVDDPRNTTKASARNAFNSQFDEQTDPTEGANPDVAATNAFFLVNSLHDVFYRYGFTEDSFNFQDDNLGNGGRANDNVLISVQDKSGDNNAQFATLPDGQNGIMQMFLFTGTNPRRDGALANDVVTHEMTHGLTNRLTGGGSAQCLKTLESGGLGEGWSDAIADWVENQSGKIEDFATGRYVVDNPAGIRTFPYSVDPKVNPLVYSDAGTANEVHLIGEVWAEMLHVLLNDLVEANGFNKNSFTDVDGTEGNVVFAHVVIDALALQPCQPTFVTARDAIIQADANRYNGAHECTIRKAFASRGLGSRANNFRDDKTVPAKCQQASTQGQGQNRAVAGPSSGSLGTGNSTLQPVSNSASRSIKRAFWGWFA